MAMSSLRYIPFSSHPYNIIIKGGESDKKHPDLTSISMENFSLSKIIFNICWYISGSNITCIGTMFLLLPVDIKFVYCCKMSSNLKLQLQGNKYINISSRFFCVILLCRFMHIDKKKMTLIICLGTRAEMIFIWPIFNKIQKSN